MNRQMIGSTIVIVIAAMLALMHVRVRAAEFPIGQEPTVVSATASAGATNGAVSVQGAGSTRALGIGAAAAANNNTCVAPWLFGAVQLEAAVCVLVELSDRLARAGHAEASVRMLCQDPRVYAAFADAGAAARVCGEAGPIGWRVHSLR